MVCNGYSNNRDCAVSNQQAVFRNTNCFGFDAVPCNGPLYNYDRLVGDVSEQDRKVYFMTRRKPNGEKVIDNDITPLYPWSRDVTATSNWDTYGLVPSYKDLCTRPNGAEVPGITRLGVYLYKSPINGIPPLNDTKCCDCLKFGKNCKNCQGYEPAEP